MNKKLLWTLALPAVLASCSQDDLISEGITNNTPQGKAISGVTFTIAKNGSDTNADTRAEWVDNKISFEKGDLVSLFWLGDDGFVQNNTNGTFTETSTPLDDAAAMSGKSNAVFRTEDGANFTAEAVVYEGYNLLVYPGNTKHVEDQEIVVSLPEEQDASEDFTKNVIYVGDSILQIHQPAYDKKKKKYYDIYGVEAGTEDPNTSGYAHGIKTGVKLLSSLFEMNLRIINTSAKDVEIQKVVLTTKGGTDEIYATSGNLVPGGTTGITSGNANVPDKTRYRNPWFKTSTDGAATEVVLNCEEIETNMGGTKVTMLLLPADVADFTGGKQPVLKVYTNYGVVTIGGNVQDGDAHSNCIFEKDGTTYAADDDNAALTEIVAATANYKDKLAVASTDGEAATISINSGVYIPRVINVDMQKAVIQGLHVSDTKELNNILNAAAAQRETAYETEPLVIYLDADKNGVFELTNYKGIDTFLSKFDEDELQLEDGKDDTAAPSTYALAKIKVNTDSETTLKNIAGLESDIVLTIPATSKINAIANGTTTINEILNPIINESVITVPAKAKITLQDNTKGTVHYTPGAQIDVTKLHGEIVSGGTVTPSNYGIIDYIASSNANLKKALQNGANYVTVADIKTGFFDGGIDATAADVTAATKGGVTIVFDNCGDLSKTISFDSNKIKAETIVLTNGTTYSDLRNATVKNIEVDSETATLGIPATATKDDIESITVKAGTTTISNLDLSNATVQVDAEATASIEGAKAVAPKNFYVYGTVTFDALNSQTNQKVYSLANGKITGIVAINGQCIVTGSLELANDLAYTKVAVSETTAITVAEGVTGLGYTKKIFVTKDEQAYGTANLKYVEVKSDHMKLSWNGKPADIEW